MTDIVERLRDENIAGSIILLDLLEEAAAKIERLREATAVAELAVIKAHDENEQLRVEIKRLHEALKDKK